MEANTAARPVPSGRHQAGGRRRSRAQSRSRRRRRIDARIPLIVVGLAVTSLAGTVGLLPLPLTLALVGLLVAIPTGDGRSITRVTRTIAVAVVMALGYLAVVASVLVGTAYPRVAATMLVVGQLTATAVIALPLIMPTYGPPVVRPSGPSAATRGGAPPPIPHRSVTRGDLVLAVTGVLVLTAAHLTGRTFVVLAVAAVALPVVVVVSRGWLARGRLARGWLVPRGRLDPNPGRRSRTELLAQLSQALNLLVLCGLLAATTLPGTYDIMSHGIMGADIVTGAIPNAATVRMVIVVGAGLGAGGAVLGAFAVNSRRRVPVAVNVLVAACSAFLVVQLAAAYRAPHRPVTLAAPFAGDWYVLQGGPSELVNSHRVEPTQRDALDLVQLTAGRTHDRDGTRLADYYAFDAPVLAPADGTVVFLTDDLADRPPSSPDPAPGNAAGNHIVIDIGDGRYVHVAHLEHGSALVNVGDRVLRGQAIARVGNSGDSAEPHLHLQVQDRPRADLGRPGVGTLPIVFQGVTMTRDGHATRPAMADVRRGDRLHADAV